MSATRYGRTGVQGKITAWHQWISDGFVEIPGGSAEYDVLRWESGSSHITIDGLNGNKGESLSFNLFDLLEAAGIEIGAVSVVGSRQRLLRKNNEPR